MVTLNGLSPVVRHDARVLVLGSFPSRASLDAGRYYGHPRNQFWRLVGAVLGADLPALTYARRLRTLKDAGIGLWDVIGACRRRGSLDSAIRDAVYNDFAPLMRRCPRLERACFNGKTAARHLEHVASFGLDVVVLPSSSPANTTPFDAKFVEWRRGLVGLERGA